MTEIKGQRNCDDSGADGLTRLLMDEERSDSGEIHWRGAERLSRSTKPEFGSEINGLAE